MWRGCVSSLLAQAGAGVWRRRPFASIAPVWLRLFFFCWAGKRWGGITSVHGEMVMRGLQREGHIPLLPKCRNNQCQCGSLFVASQLGPAKHPLYSEQTVRWDFLEGWLVQSPNAMRGSHSLAVVGAFSPGLSIVLSSFKPEMRVREKDIKYRLA